MWHDVMYTTDPCCTVYTVVYDAIQIAMNLTHTRNTLDCDQSNYWIAHYFLLTVYNIPIELVQLEMAPIRSADPETIYSVNKLKWIGWPIADIAIRNFQNEIGRSLVGRQYILIMRFLIQSISISHSRVASQLRRRRRRRVDVRAQAVASMPDSNIRSSF